MSDVESSAMVPSDHPARAFGRSLDHFGDLSRAESRLLDCCSRGEVAVIGENLPESETELNRVRANFIRFLALGGDERAPVHERGVQLQGAWVTGILDFEAAKVQHRLPLWNCRIERIDAYHAVFKFLNLSGCLLEKGILGDGLVCEGDIFLRDYFVSTGQISLRGARIGGNLECNFGRFENQSGEALSFDGAHVEGTFFFRSVQGIVGDVVLAAMRCANLSDDIISWLYADGRLVLDGFIYERLAGGAETDAKIRIAWLSFQRQAHLNERFRPQPWEQLITVLRTMGHPTEARRVAIEKQHRLRRAKRIPRGGRTLHWLYGLLVGYGYRPSRLLASIVIVWLACAGAYWWAANPGGMGPSTYLIAPPTPIGEVAPAADYSNFVPLVYSADVLLPVVDLGYKDEWQPVVRDDLFLGRALRFLYWFEIAFGWVAGLLLVSVLGALIKKD